MNEWSEPGSDSIPIEMKICFFNESYWPDVAATGQLLTELAEDLAATPGFEVTVVAGRALHGAGPARRQWTLVSEEVRHGVRILRANGATCRPDRFVGRVANYLSYFACACMAGLRERPDLVVSLTDPPIIGLAALMTARRSRGRFVFVCEDIFPEVARLLEDFQSPLVNRLLDRLNRFLLGRADAVVALGERMRQRLVEEKGVAADRVTIIHNWADTQAITPLAGSTSFAEAHGLAGRFVVMHSGNVGLSQALDSVLDAAALLKQSTAILFVIIGAGTKHAALERRAAREGLTNIRFLPYQPKERLGEAFAAADLFLVSLAPGLEGYIVPSKVYGILAAGRPYLAAVHESAEPAAIAREHDCGVVVPPANPEALANAIRALAGNPETVVRMGHHARDASRYFDRRVAVRAYAELFNRVAGQDAGSAIVDNTGEGQKRLRPCRAEDL